MSRQTHLKQTDFHLPYNSDLVFRAKTMRQNPTPAEKKLWRDCLRHLPVRFLRQRPIEHFIVDFYCAALRLVIEVDGDSHFTEQGQSYDAERSAILEGYGLSIVRFTNQQVLEEFDAVSEQINELPLNPPFEGGFRGIRSMRSTFNLNVGGVCRLRFEV
ncbi:endonuclease domain-containing protein [filamentous cyanobacterium LEGE 11480]|uniref:Endonuclease domain-containing protein n=1 Tax=Romeriopsis navalis LEGE 11480 TaxID=2777977 RepID=A0A928VQ95_9CYAN|nr:endonuclease domain-containing protein [Romeriopsis navalis]MBE9032691.1 endonuclease domain-containing protein [Romeriopsis navalis LEGE 11480]